MVTKSQKELVLCGDSWFAGDNRHLGKSPGEILEQRHNLSLITLARSSATNFAIALQIDHAIKLNPTPDFIIVATTASDRLDLPVLDKVTSEFAYSPVKGIRNIIYNKRYDISNQFNWSDSDASVDSQTIQDFLEGTSSTTNEQRRALKEYIGLLYDSGIKQQVDCWIMNDAIRRLKQSGIPYIICIEPLYNGEFLENADWIPLKNKITYHDFFYRGMFVDPKVNDVNFHLTDKDAVKFANYLELRLKQHKFL
jgi:hypothetical protein